MTPLFRMTPNMKIIAAPMQGLTEALYRRVHAATAGHVDQYRAPFLRIDRGEIRRKEIRDISPEANAGIDLVPQIIFRDIDEFDRLTGAVAGAGHSRIDLNLGCPFPPQVSRGRGAGTLLNSALLRQVVQRIGSRREITFSAKIRSGVDNGDQWQEAVSIMNKAPLDHLTVHPRYARQQYRGTADIDTFRRICAASRHPVVYNGDIRSLEDYRRIAGEFPDLHGVMIGRGLMANPLLAAEIVSGTEFSDAERTAALLKILEQLSAGLCRSLEGGRHQITSHLRPYLEYAEPLLGRRTVKQLLKEL
ncbi:MAG: tRNA-dihydrouridine synthase family protein [Clostridium sp.]|nr:tRNA-dihydrouridine synthase family protein [Clostridium sp.]